MSKVKSTEDRNIIDRQPTNDRYVCWNCGLSVPRGIPHACDTEPEIQTLDQEYGEGVDPWADGRKPWVK